MRIANPIYQEVVLLAAGRDVDPLAQGLAQLDDYMAKLDPDRRRAGARGARSQPSIVRNGVTMK